MRKLILFLGNSKWWQWLIVGGLFITASWIIARYFNISGYLPGILFFVGLLIFGWAMNAKFEIFNWWN